MLDSGPYNQDNSIRQAEFFGGAKGINSKTISIDHVGEVGARYYCKAEDIVSDSITIKSRATETRQPQVRPYSEPVRYSQPWGQANPTQGANSGAVSGQAKRILSEGQIHEEPGEYGDAANSRSMTQGTSTSSSSKCAESDLGPTRSTANAQSSGRPHYNSDPTHGPQISAMRHRDRGQDASIDTPAPLRVDTHNSPLSARGSVPPLQPDYDGEQENDTDETFYTPASDLPQYIRNHADAFLPRFFVELGITNPFDELALEKIWSIWRTSVPDISVNDNTELHIVGLAVDAKHEWQQRFVNRALMFLDSAAAELKLQNTKDGVCHWLQEMSQSEVQHGELSVAKGGETKRMFQFKFVASTLSAHIEAVPKEARFEPFPCGAYAFALGACQLALSTWMKDTEGTPPLSQPDKTAVDKAFTTAVSMKDYPKGRQEIVQAAIDYIPYYQVA